MNDDDMNFDRCCHRDIPLAGASTITASPSVIEDSRLRPNTNHGLGGLHNSKKTAGAVNLGGTLLISHQRKMSNPGIDREAAAFQRASADAIRAATGSN